MFKIVDNICLNLQALLAKPISSFCRLETAESKHILVANDGSLISAMELSGNLRMMGREEFDSLVERLTEMLKQSVFKGKGHSLQVVMMRDPQGSHAEVHDAMRPTRVAAASYNLNLNEFLLDWEKAVSEFCAVEHVWLVVWTNAKALPTSEIKHASRKMSAADKNAPPVDRGTAQGVAHFLGEIKNKHIGVVDGIRGIFRKCEMIARVMTAHDLLWWVRHSVDPAFTSRDWRVLLPGDPLPKQLPDPEEDDLVSSLLYPSLKRQLFPREAEEIDRATIRIGEHIHTPLIMDMPPQRVRPFDDLFQTLTHKTDPFPWRISFLMEGEGLDGLFLKHLVSSILHFTSTSNKLFNRAVDELKQLELDGERIIKLKICLDTWTNANHPEAKERIRKQAAEIVSALQGWGSCDARDVIGDPLLGTMATIPAMMPTSPAPATAAPLSDVVSMLPLTRPTLPWKHGSLLLRSPDGRLLPYLPGSSRQTSWVDIGFAPMGKGKSVYLNCFNLAYLLQPGLNELPWLSIIDIGPSSSGLIKVLQYALPSDKRHLAAYHRLRNEVSYAINPFDTPLGCRRPFDVQKAFLVQLLSLFGTPLDKNAPPNGISGLSRAVIDATYEEFSDERNPKPYSRFQDPEIDNLVDNLGIHVNTYTSWWDIVDAFFDEGYIHEATLAQRYAVPLLSDISARANDEKVRRMYTNEVEGGEPVTQFFMRACNEAIQDYSILSEPTRFDLGEARVVSLDLAEVAPRGGAAADRQAGIMYMLGRHVLGSKFFFQPEDSSLAPERYRKYLLKQIRALKIHPKRICYDEIHRVSRNSSVSQVLLDDIQMVGRESRKDNLSLGLYSQDLSDFSEIIVEQASTVVIMGVGTEVKGREIQKRFSLNESIYNALMRLSKPDRAGADMIAVFQTDEGRAQHLVTLTVEPKFLWACSTTTEDVGVRDQLYDRIDFFPTLKYLSQKWPGGLKQEAERRKRLKGMGATTEKVEDILDDIVEEVVLEFKDQKAF